MKQGAVATGGGGGGGGGEAQDSQGSLGDNRKNYPYDVQWLEFF